MLRKGFLAALVINYIKHKIVHSIATMEAIQNVQSCFFKEN